MSDDKKLDMVMSAIAEELSMEFDHEMGNASDRLDIEGSTIDLRGFFAKESGCLICKANAAAKRNTILAGNKYEFRHGEVCKKHFREITAAPNVECLIIAKTDLDEEVALSAQSIFQGN